LIALNTISVPAKRQRSKFLRPLHAREWRTPSQAQPKNMFGHENRTRFSATARLHGRIVWRGWFDDRNDFEQFIWAMFDGPLDRYVQRLPTPWWNPDLREYGEGLTYEFITTVFLVSGTSWSPPSDFRGINGRPGEFIDTIGAGGSGGGTGASNAKASGAGGGGWSQITSYTYAGGNVTVQVGAGGPQISVSAGGTSNGNTGTDTFFGAGTLAGSNVGAKGGVNGVFAASAAAANGGAGGAAASGIGTTKRSGGRGGNLLAAHTNAATGGGGGAGSTADGSQGVDTAAVSTATTGGAGDGGSGGAGTAGQIVTGTATPASSANGNAGTEYDASHGSGGASGGSVTSGSGTSSTSGTGGAYGAASGGVKVTSTNTGTAKKGGDGLIVIAYAPLALSPFARPMRFYTRKF
jgi:hypothetical protein